MKPARVLPPRLLIVAGSDSSGGAGIQADIKTAQAFGCYAMTAITAVTAQNTRGVGAIHAVPPDMVAAQIKACLTDIGVDAIKIGMLGTTKLIKAVAAALPKAVPIVLDPVMVSTSGDRLLPDTAVVTLVKELFPRATLVTPNLPEAKALVGRGDAESAARKLMAMGARAALIKGGHATNATVDDVMVWRGGVETYAFPRIRTRHTHGTGCTLSTAIACGLAQHLSLPLAVGRAREYVQAAIQTAPGLGKGHGPLNHAVTR
ncbi:MAG: bifunctional hydroxymethylpyrimidine kinase/phosphomethylpyrimidine kinase [Alphaproteobacteria bacterium]|nr:bifunctional hydroxymethylpyrimidine kinase/phosphomethylpyrimidine kinase [Alphaproteobacteria bacterium]